MQVCLMWACIVFLWGTYLGLEYEPAICLYLRSNGAAKLS
jgi:hypothetical protein